MANAKPGRLRSSSEIKTLGDHPDDKKPVKVMKGKFGPYIKYQQSFVSIKDIDPSLISLAQCIELIKEKRIQDAQKYINVFNEEDPVIEVLNGRYGPYIKSAGKNYKIPKKVDPKKLSRLDCLDLISNSKKTRKK